MGLQCDCPWNKSEWELSTAYLTVIHLLYESVELLMLNFSIEMISVSYRNVEKNFMIR